MMKKTKPYIPAWMVCFSCITDGSNQSMIAQEANVAYCVAKIVVDMGLNLGWITAETVGRQKLITLMPKGAEIKKHISKIIKAASGVI